MGVSPLWQVRAEASSFRIEERPKSVNEINAAIREKVEPFWSGQFQQLNQIGLNSRICRRQTRCALLSLVFDHGRGLRKQSAILVFPKAKKHER
jgi:hypothetical protein